MANLIHYFFRCSRFKVHDNPYFFSKNRLLIDRNIEFCKAKSRFMINLDTTGCLLLCLDQFKPIIFFIIHYFSWHRPFRTVFHTFLTSQSSPFFLSTFLLRNLPSNPLNFSRHWQSFSYQRSATLICPCSTSSCPHKIWIVCRSWMSSQDPMFVIRQYSSSNLLVSYANIYSQ